MDNIFVSYRRADSADVTGRIHDRLSQYFGRERIFTDVDSIPLGVNFKKHLDKRIGDCKVFLAVIGRDWLGAEDEGGHRRLDDPTDVVRIELESALERRIPVIPLLVRGASIPALEDLPESLRDLAYRQGIDVRPNPDFHNDVDRLICGLERHVPARKRSNMTQGYPLDAIGKASEAPAKSANAVTPRRMEAVTGSTARQRWTERFVFLGVVLLTFMIMAGVGGAFDEANLSFTGNTRNQFDFLSGMIVGTVPGVLLTGVMFIKRRRQMGFLLKGLYVLFALILIAFVLGWLSQMGI